MSRSSWTAVAPPSGHQRPPSTSRTRALLLCQRARWPDPTPRSPLGRSAPGTAAGQRTPRCGPRAPGVLGDVPGPGNRGGGTPAATGRGYVLAAALRASYVAGKHTRVASKQAKQQGLLPVCCPRPHSRRRPRRRRSVSPGRTHETPGDPRVRALPSPYRARAVVSPGVSCRRARSHAGPGASTRTVTGLWMTVGTSRARLLTAPERLWTTRRRAGDDWLSEKSLCSPRPAPKARGGPVDRKKLRMRCRDPVRYSGR
jgi:hypothetical protein